MLTLHYLSSHRYRPHFARSGRATARLLVAIVMVACAALFLVFGPYSASGHCRSGRAWTDQKDYAKAITEYSEAIRINPKLAEAYDGRGFAWSVKKDYAKAIADFDQAIRLDPRSDHAYYERANAWLESKDYDKAIQDYTEAINLNTESPYAYYARAGAWIQKKEFDKAIADDSAFLKRMEPLLENLDERPGSKDGEMNAFYAMAASAFTERGSAWQMKNDNDKALSHFNEAIHLDPQNAAAHICRGSVWQGKSDYAKALADYDEAIRLDNSDFAAYAHRAMILAASPDPKYRDGLKAFAAAKKACELTAGKDATSLEALAMAYAEAGDFELAVKWQTQAMAAPNQIREMRIEQETRLALYQQKTPYRYPPAGKP
jgi:tetratricopeptide (TPR) repeat protein